MAGKKRSAGVRLALEMLERRDLLAADPALGITSALFLASARAEQAGLISADDDLPPLSAISSSAAALAPGLPNHAPAGTDKTVTTLEDTAYTFTAADFGFTDPDEDWVPSGAPSASNLAADNLLVLYNTASAEGIQIANYYAQVHPGVHLLGIDGVDPIGETVTADFYLSTIRPQVLAGLTPSIDVIVTTKGLPLRITVTQSEVANYVDPYGTSRTVLSWRPYSSLESELTRVDFVSSWQMMGDQSYNVSNHYDWNPYYLANSSFDYGTSGIRLTARLDGYTLADVLASIDRAQQAFVGPNNHPGGPVYFLVDNDPSKSYSAYVANLVNNVLDPAGLPVVYDNTSAFVDTAPGPIIGYDSHGVHQASTPPLYLLDGLNATLANGAVFESWESFNAYSFDPNSTSHTNQGQVAQWLQIGGTAGVGHVEEPTASASTVTNEDQMFRMLLAGYTFAESAWSANKQLSFVNTVVGDPLMTWQRLTQGENALEAVKITTVPPAGTLTNNDASVMAGQFISAANIASGLLKFAPTANANGSSYASFTFQVQDDGGTANGGIDLDQSPNTMTINVTPVDDPTDAIAGVVGWWKFDEGSGSVAGDSSGNNHQATLQGGATFTSGHSGSALKLSASSQRAIVDDSADLDVTSAITLSAWIAPSRKGTQTIVKKGRSSTVDGYELSLSSTGKVFVRFNQDTSGDKYRVNSTSKYPTNGATWMHVVATYDGATIRLYINGQLQGSKAAVFTIKTNNTALAIGAEDTGAKSMRGAIDDVLVANRALTEDEISALYQGTLPPSGTTNFAPVVSAGADLATSVGIPLALGGSASDDGLPQPAALSSQWTKLSGPGTVAFGDAASPTTTATFSSAGTYVLRLTASDGALTASDDATVTVAPEGASTDVVGLWNFDEGSGSVAGDASGNGNQGTLQGGASFGSGHSLSALVLTASSQRVTVNDAASLDITDAITISAWIAPNLKGTQTVVKKGRNGSVDGYELSLSSSGKVFVRFNEDTSGNAYRLDSSSSYPTNGSTWIHVGATYDGATIRMYINGVLQSSKAAAFTIKTNDTALAIGAEDTGARSMRGAIDDVLVANRALSASEILSLYQGTFG